MELSLVLSFLAASTLLALMPGPDNIYVLTESVTKGSRTGVAVSIGLCSGVLIHTLAAATGLSLILQQSETAFNVIKYLGAAYLLYLAYMASQDKAAPIEIEEKATEDKINLFPLIRKGFFMNVLNPKVSLFFIAFLPQFVSDAGWSIPVQMIALGIIFMIQSLVIFSGIALLAGRLTQYVKNPRFWIYTKWVSVTVLSVLALSLFLA